MTASGSQVLTLIFVLLQFRSTPGLPCEEIQLSLNCHQLGKRHL